MKKMKMRIAVVLTIMAMLWGFCYYYETVVTRLIYDGMICRAKEMTDDAAELVKARLEKDESPENVIITKEKLKAAKLFGTTGCLHLVDSNGVEVQQTSNTIPFDCKPLIPAIVNRYPEARLGQLLTNDYYRGIYQLHGSSYCFAYKATGFRDWYVVNLVPVEKAFRHGQQAVQETFKLVAAIIIILGILAAYILYENNDKRNKLYAMAYKDDITGLGNKNQYFKIMKDMAKDKKSKQIWCLLLFNVHNFKWVNDNFGLLSGNEVLKQLGEILEKNYCRDGEQVMRLSADIFLMLKPLEVWREPEGFAQNILADIGTITLEGKSLNLKASAGGVIFRASSVMDGHTILDAAVHAQEEAATKLEPTVVICSEDVIAKHKADNALLEDLKKDIEEQKLEVFYQAKYAPETNAIMGAEALVRWKHQARGYISPGIFIPLVEQRGFIWLLTQLVFSQVCRDIKNWRCLGLHIVPISVNVSAHDLFQTEFLSFLVENLHRYQIQPGDIELEITETSIMYDLRTALDLLRQLKNLGFKLNIDDFGTGYSSLSYLQEGVFDVIKLDRSFLVQRDKFKAEGEKLITSIVDMGKKLGLRCICEGAETEEQVAFLRKIKVDGIQGFYYAKPETEIDFRHRIM